MTAFPSLDESDAEAIRKVRGGDVRAFALIVDRHKEHGMTLAYRMLRNREEAEEALQDAFIRAYKSLGSFEMRSSFSTWFYRIVFNVCSTRLSRRKDVHKRASENDEEIIAAQGDDRPLPDSALESDQTDGIIREEIENLPESYGTTFMLFAVHERSYEEIMEITGVALGTVKARLFRARAMLREAIARRLEIDPAAGLKRKEQAA